MNNLTEIYPFGKIEKDKNLQADFLSLPFEGKWFTLPLNQLSKTEIQLLKKLYPEDFQVEGNRHPWYQILFSGASIPKRGAFRILQIHLQSMPAYSKNDWLLSIEEMLKPLDSFFIKEKELLLVEKKSRSNFSLDDLKGLFATLDADFDATTKVYVGNFFTQNENPQALFKEEQTIFNKERSRFLQENFLSLAPVALDYLTKDAIQKSLVMQSFASFLRQDQDLVAIIKALLHNQGNISSAAKDLFMHRNTLQYRLDKFHEQTGFHLKNIEDLTLCYLLIQEEKNTH